MITILQLYIRLLIFVRLSNGQSGRQPGELARSRDLPIGGARVSSPRRVHRSNEIVRMDLGRVRRRTLYIYIFCYSCLNSNDLLFQIDKDRGFAIYSCESRIK